MAVVLWRSGASGSNAFRAWRHATLAAMASNKLREPAGRIPARGGGLAQPKLQASRVRHHGGAEPTGPSSRNQGHRVHIILVEDDPQLGAAIQRALQRLSYTVTWLRDGRTALAALADRTADLVLLDLGLPGRDGLDVLIEARRSQVRHAGDHHDRARWTGGPRGRPRRGRRRLSGQAVPPRGTGRAHPFVDAPAARAGGKPAGGRRALHGPGQRGGELPRRTAGTDPAGIRAAADPDGTRRAHRAARDAGELDLRPGQRGRSRCAGSAGAHAAAQARCGGGADRARLRLHDAAGAANETGRACAGGCAGW